MRALLLLFVVSFTAVTQAAQQTFLFEAYELPENGRIVIPVAKSDELQGTVAKVNELTNGAIARAVIESEFAGETGDTLTLFGTPPYSRIDLIGVGEGPIDRNAAENFGGSAAVIVADVRGGEINILWQLDAAAEATAARVAFGYELRSYRFDRYQEDRVDASTLPAVNMLSDDNSASNMQATSLTWQKVSSWPEI